MYIKSKKEKFMDGCRYTAFLLGIIAPGGFAAIFVASQSDSEVLLSVVGTAVCIFQVYFLGTLDRYKE